MIIKILSIFQGQRRWNCAAISWTRLPQHAFRPLPLPNSF